MQSPKKLCHFPFALQQRGQKLQGTAKRTDCKVLLSAVVHIDLFALCKGGKRILFYLGNCTASIHPDTALKMQVHTPVVHIDCSDRCNFIIADKTFGMDKTRRILVNLNP